MKEKALFVAEVAACLVVIALVQQNLMNIPMFGQYLPGYKATAA